MSAWRTIPRWGKALLIFVGVIVGVWLLLLLTAITASAHSREYNARHATKVITVTVGRHGLGAGGSCEGASGVRGNVTVKNTIYLRGTPFLLGWISVGQEYWCWDSTRITGWGAVHQDSYHRPGYCWDGLNTTDQWWSPWWERKASTTGSFGVTTTVFGCLGVNSASARLYYQGDSHHHGTFNMGGS